uniref:Uncharacterized protein n=1 Tax=Tanacetum cinerariifolium TaxID=118510 RepID=A0A6L2KQD3_TANCI|nr:hypothetical protein [Tanacetum cinerariifolium]
MLQLVGFRASITDVEFEVSKPSDTRITSSHSSASSDSTAPLPPDHPLTQASPTPTPTRVSFHRRTARMAVRTQPTLSPSMSARIAKVAALSPSSFCKRYRSSYETPSPSSSLTLPIRKRYRGTSELILDTETEGESSDSDVKREGSEDEGPCLEDEGPGLNDEGYGLDDEGPGLKEEEKATSEGQQQAVPVVDTAVDEPLGLGCGALRRRELALKEGSVPNMFEVGQSSRSVPEQEEEERIYAFRHLTLVTWVDPEDGRVYTDILTYVPPAAHIQTPPSPEWSSGSLPVLPSSLVVPSPIASPVTTPAAIISVDEDQDLRELCIRSWAVRDEIFSQRYRFRSLEWEQERTTVTLSAIWRPMENHDLRRQIAEERRERLELTDSIARMKRR